MQLFLFLLKASWQRLAIASLTGFFSGIFSAGLIALMNHILHNWGQPQPLSWLVGFVALASASLLCGVVSQLVLIRLAQDSIFQLRIQLGRQILGADLAQLERLGGGALMATLTEDVQAIANAFWLIPFLCIDLAMVIGALGYILWLSWQMLLLVCLIIFSFLGIYKKILVKAKRELNQSRYAKDRLFEQFKGITDGAKELKLNFDRRESFFNDDLQVTATQTRDYQVRGLSWFSLIDNFGKFAFFMTFGLVLFVFPKVLQMDSGTLSGYLITFTYLSKPLESLIARLPTLSQASVALDKIDALNLSLQDQQEQVHTQAPPAIVPQWQQLKLQNIHHTYPGDQEDQRFSLGTLNLNFTPGELVFIIGGNGSGKSTLAKLLTGLYIPETGQIEFNGTPITDTNREWYRQHFSVVFADFFLFDRLLGVTQDRLATAATAYLDKLKLTHKVAIEGDRLSTTALSQGQRKRLALLYAWLEDRPIYLFDEWAADQDPSFREIFYTQFLPELKAQGKTVFVISHDDHYFSVADRMIKLEYGSLEYDKRR